MKPLGCVPSDHTPLGRRDLWKIGGIGLLGMGISDIQRLQAETTGSHPKGKARSIVFIFQSGGPSQHETFDPKPEATENVRGEYGVTQTDIPGVLFCEHLPKLASRAKQFSVLRTMHHVAGRAFRNEHSSCHYLLHTGSTRLPEGDTNQSILRPRSGRFQWPSIASMITYCGESRALPAAVEIPRMKHMSYPGRGPGVLGASFAPWGVDLAPVCNAPDAAGSCPNCFSHDDPNDPARAPGPEPGAWWDNTSCRNPNFHLPDVGKGPVLSVPHIQRRQSLLRHLDQLRHRIDDQLHANEKLVSYDAYHNQALRLIVSSLPGSKNPFDLSQESGRTRDLYGREEWGQGFLVARRLIEAGVRMVQINLRGWDTHQNAFRDLKGKLLPSLDHCLSGFLDDLQQRGLLEETLIVMCGEMGRTPRVSPISPNGKNRSGEPFSPGRHHWGDVFPCLIAGGGTRPGQIVGRTDSEAGLPDDVAYTPSDLAATIFHAFGIRSDAQFQDAAGRPYFIYRGHPVSDLF
ncbi:MAG: DUF1501 domain-containing protein [Planctomycetota bacterium]|nr:DUF1501 domain-containing protein [Planctomycetota bacterium]